MRVQPGILHEVRQRLLDDPVDSHPERGRRRRRLTGNTQLDAIARMSHQFGNVVQAGGRPVLGGLVGIRIGAQDPNDAAHLTEGVPSGLKDGALI